MKKKYLIALFLLSLTIFASKKADNIIIFKVIPDAGISSVNVDMLNISIETNLTRLGYGIINEKIQNEAIEEQKKQQNSDCYDDSCLVDTGRMLAAKKLLIIKISRQSENNFFIKLRKIDIESGIIENSFASARSIDFKNYEDINNNIKELLKKIINLNVKQMNNYEKKDSVVIKKYLLKINTDVDYEISYSPMIKSKISIYEIPDYSKRKYFEKNAKLIYLPKGKYQLILSKKGYKNIYKKVNLFKDTTINIISEKEMISYLGLETVFEYKRFSGINENHFHSGVIVDLLTYRTKGLKMDFLRFGFLSDFKSNNSLKEIKFSMFNMEVKSDTNFLFSFTLGYLLGDGSFLFTTDKDKNDLYLTPFGIKLGYFIHLDENLDFKLYGKFDWLMYTLEKGTANNTTSISLGTSFEYFFLTGLNYENL